MTSYTNKTIYSKITKETPTNKKAENAGVQTNNRMEKKQNNFRIRYENRKKHNRKF